MSLINQESWPGPMWATMRLLAFKSHPVSFDEARALLSPPTLGVGVEDMFETAVMTLESLGLVTRLETGKLARSGPVADLDGQDYDAFIAVLRQVVIDPRRNTDLGISNSQAGPRDLCRALCWFLSEDPLGRPLNWEAAEQAQINALNEDAGPAIINNTRWPRFVEWATALGFGTTALPIHGTAAQIVPDCTRAVRQTVRDLWKPNETVPAVEFLSRLREALPVIPGGALSMDVGIRSPGEGVAGFAVSFAILRGMDEGWLTLRRDADARFSLSLHDHDAPASPHLYSTVTIHKDHDDD
ncbi:protein DpdG [Nonomuraea sp. NPDC049625]|uniref:protein DpdG n=1 Tax=Nonomuraea sp. NPDC049625 TaxID=3155775 RepID=UPI00342064E4